MEALAKELSDPFGLVHASCMNVFIRELRRETSAAQKVIKTMTELASEHGWSFWDAWSNFLRGWVMIEQGGGEEEIVKLQEGLAAWQATGSRTAVPYFHTLLARAYEKVGQAEKGISTLEEALAEMKETDERYYEAEVHRLRGQLLLKKGEADSNTENCFQQALEVSRRQQAKSLELRAAMSMSRLWQKQSKQKEAHKLLSEIYGWFTEGFDTKDLQDAKALLEELS